MPWHIGRSKAGGRHNVRHRLCYQSGILGFYLWVPNVIVKAARQCASQLKAEGPGLVDEDSAVPVPQCLPDRLCLPSKVFLTRLFFFIASRDVLEDSLLGLSGRHFNPRALIVLLYFSMPLFQFVMAMVMSIIRPESSALPQSICQGCQYFHLLIPSFLPARSGFSKQLE